MGKTEVLLFALIFGVAGFRLYQKYIKKDQGKSGSGNKSGSSDTSFPSSKDDDYEPYKKK